MTKRLNTALAAPDPIWQLRFLDARELDYMDALLVQSAHPLAFEPGTQESRFLKLARAKHQF